MGDRRGVGDGIGTAELAASALVPPPSKASWSAAPARYWLSRTATHGGLAFGFRSVAGSSSRVVSSAQAFNARSSYPTHGKLERIVREKVTRD